MINYLDLTDEQQMWTIRNNNLNIADTPEEVVCPWCSEVQTHLSFEDVSYQDDHISEFECGDCEKKFEVRTRVTYEWWTELPDDYLNEQALKEIPNE